ncbi:MAG: hypothetical protein OXC44_01700 [Proteobacteria bacterium]|nr:hypothetical protein [Pseudomonadota bacterium]
MIQIPLTTCRLFFSNYCLMASTSITMMWLSIAVMGCQQTKPLANRGSPPPFSEANCNGPSQLWINDKCVNFARNKGQHTTIPDVPECSETNHGKVLSVNGQTSVPSKTSEKHIFLRCIFHGGDLRSCVAHNSCQVLLNNDNCETELKNLKKLYPEVTQKFSCQTLDSLQTP